MRRIAILGSTGSIGQQTLEVLSANPGAFDVYALSAQRNTELLIKQALAFHPRYVGVYDGKQARALDGRLPEDVVVLSGDRVNHEICALPEVDDVLIAVVGAIGLPIVMEAIAYRKRILLANKEALVIGGALVMREVRRHGVTLLPLDSEHSAIWQCITGPEQVMSVTLTASGGPFRGQTRAMFEHATPREVLKHPTWKMGQRITVDSASLINKAFEIIEARWLFDLAPEQIAVMIHPQSIIHSMVHYRDGSTLAQLGWPDMRTPIACALFYPQRQASRVETLDLLKVGKLTFEAPDEFNFPALPLAYEVLSRGGVVPAMLQAADEIAVQAFLAERIPFGRIVPIVQEVVERAPTVEVPALEDILYYDALARRLTLERL